MKPVNLTKVGRFLFTRACLAEVEDFLRAKGSEDEEGLALVAGTPKTPSEILIDRAYFPAQDSSTFHVQVLENGMLDVHNDLLGQERLLVGQIHTHPCRAFHSDVDDEDTTLTQPGSFSIVVPLFADLGLRGWLGCAVYRRTIVGWTPRLDPDAITALLAQEE